MAKMKYSPRTKYRNKPTYVDGRRFDSRREARRYQDLLLLQAAGQISHLDCQVRFPLVVGTELICTYVADFCYRENEKGIVEDCKGYRTREYKIKKKLMRAIRRIEIKET